MNTTATWNSPVQDHNGVVSKARREVAEGKDIFRYTGELIELTLQNDKGKCMEAWLLLSKHAWSDDRVVRHAISLACSAKKSVPLPPGLARPAAPNASSTQLRTAVPNQQQDADTRRLTELFAIASLAEIHDSVRKALWRPDQAYQESARTASSNALAQKRPAYAIQLMLKADALPVLQTLTGSTDEEVAKFAKDVIRRLTDPRTGLEAR